MWPMTMFYPQIQAQSLLYKCSINVYKINEYQLVERKWLRRKRGEKNFWSVQHYAIVFYAA